MKVQEPSSAVRVAVHVAGLRTLRYLQGRKQLNQKEKVQGFDKKSVAKKGGN
jgi:hypothetical protein